MPFLTLSNNPEKRQRQVERGQAVDRENERRMNVQELFDAINMIRAQENTVVRRKPESQGDIPRYASPRSEPRHEMREAPLPSYTDTLGALKYNLSPTLGVAQLVALPALVYDLGETAVDALRGTNSPSRFRQVANALSKGMGGPSMPNTAAEWRGELAGSLLNPANFVSAVGSPLRMLRSVPAALRHGAEGFAQAVPVSNVIKNKGGNWLSGSVEDALRGLKKPVREDTYLAQIRSQHDAPEGMYESVLSQNAKANAINSFIDKQLTRYVKSEMATPEDPIRALAERGVLHFAAPEMHYVHPRVELARADAGFPKEGVAASPLARSWENLSDAVPSQASYLDHLPTHSVGNGSVKTALENQFGKFAAENPEALAYGWNRGRTPADLGFDHLVDELANATRAHAQEQKWADAVARAAKSGVTDPVQIERIARVTRADLPRHLQLDPKSMDRVSVPQAVERVSQINAWRAAQKAEADALRANNAATVLHKDYPDKGFKWVELRQPDETGRLVQGAERMDPRFEIPQEIQDQFQEQAYQEALRRGIADESDDMMGFVEGRTQELARQWDAKNPARIDEARKTLQDALKYEGDTMGHCVGGYCDDVASGRSRIYSLRDAKGQPHVTVEVQPMKAGYLPEPSVDPSADIAPRIVQIKGKQNRAPNEEYLPFVQDFVRSGRWSDVGDLQNTGMSRVNWSPENLKGLQEFSIPYPEVYGTPDEVNAALNALNKAKGFARGGSVSAPVTVSDLRAIMAQLRMEHSNA